MKTRKDHILSLAINKKPPQSPENEDGPTSDFNLNQSSGTHDIDVSLVSKNPMIRSSSLQCYEHLGPSSDEENNLFEDSDDSVKDKTYSPVRSRKMHQNLVDVTQGILSDGDKIPDNDKSINSNQGLLNYGYKTPDNVTPTKNCKCNQRFFSYGNKTPDNVTPMRITVSADIHTVPATSRCSVMNPTLLDEHQEFPSNGDDIHGNVTPLSSSYANQDLLSDGDKTPDNIIPMRITVSADIHTVPATSRCSVMNPTLLDEHQEFPSNGDDIHGNVTPLSSSYANQDLLSDGDKTPDNIIPMKITGFADIRIVSTTSQIDNQVIPDCTTTRQISRTEATGINLIETNHEIHTFEDTESAIAQSNIQDGNICEESTSNGKGLTKSGEPRKRKRPEMSVAERKMQKRATLDEKLSLKPPCNDKCRLKCTSKITEETRKTMNKRYVQLNWESRGLYIKGMVEPFTIKTRKAAAVQNPKRNVSYHYHFIVNNEKIQVCQTFFLTTLGYNSKNNRHVHMALNKTIDNQKDKRGTHQRTHTINKELIKEHIRAYEPTISYYRREHAPNRLYLPSDISITSMHKQFIEKNPNINLSLETYRRVVKEMNISFAHLGNEECEQCATHKQHTINVSCDEATCDICVNYKLHSIRYRETRQEYKNDRKKCSTDNECIYYSVDLQKVVMLPRMEQFKIGIFCPRMIVFNETFVPLGNSNQTNLPYAVIWNESVSGRNQEDIPSTFRSFFIHHRDAKHIVVWADNCAAQNKNWALLSFLVNIVNSNMISTESITIKYFEPGHTFMSADSFHHQVERSLQRKGKVFDFEDFLNAVKAFNSTKNEVKVMSTTDFFMHEDYISQHKLKNQEPRVYLKDIMAVKVEKGEFTIKHKHSHRDADWKVLDFLQVKIMKKPCFPDGKMKSVPQGISKERKQEIVSKLLPFMPENRRNFWISLPVSND